MEWLQIGMLGIASGFHADPGHCQLCYVDASAAADLGSVGGAGRADAIGLNQQRRGASIYRELELTLSARAADLPALECALAEMTPVSVSMPERLITTCHDTRDLALQRRGLTLSVREQGGQFIQTLRAADPAGAGMLSRREWEAAIADRRPDPRAPMSGAHLPDCVAAICARYFSSM